MKKLAAGFFGITLIFFASLCSATYLIYLKDGREITTHEYWEEDDQIKFKQYGGVMGIQKDFIVEIEEIEDLPEEKAPHAEAETPTAKDEVGKQGGAFGDEKDDEKLDANETGNAPEVRKKGEKKTAQPKSIKEYWEQKKALKVQLDAAIEKMREAAEKNNFVKRKEMVEEVKKISKEIHRLADEVKQMNNGKLPDFWEN